MGKTKINISFDWKDLEADLIKYSKHQCARAASLIANEMTETALYAIARFYSSYTPVYYKRHYYNFMDKSFRRYYRNQSHANNFQGGVEMSPDFMDEIYQDPVNEVFDMVYAGYHGVASGFAEPESFARIPTIMRPSPMELIFSKLDDIEDNLDEFLNKGAEYAAAQNYKVLNMR